MRAANTTYVITHDDDDSWNGEFLARSIAQLGRYKALVPNTRGIICHAKVIKEVISDNTVVEQYRFSLNGWVKTVGIVQLCATNFIPPISFLFERDVFNELGYFRDFKYAEDWDFYLRFVSKYEIAVLPEHLANYHIRPRAENIYGNTAAIGRDQHFFIVTALRNELIRQDLTSGRFGLGGIVALAVRPPISGNLKHRFWGLWRETEAKWNVRRVLNKLELFVLPHKN